VQWLIALGVFVAGLGLLVLAVRAGKNSPRPKGGGAIGAFGAGLEEAFDRRGAMILEENQKRLEMEGEEEGGDPPLEKGPDE
jgi:hypothetical protein